MHISETRVIIMSNYEAISLSNFMYNVRHVLRYVNFIIFTAMHENPFANIIFETSNQAPGVLDAFFRYIRQSTCLYILTLADYADEADKGSGDKFASICNAVGHSPSLRDLILAGTKVHADNHD